MKESEIVNDPVEDLSTAEEKEAGEPRRITAEYLKCLDSDSEGSGCWTKVLRTKSSLSFGQPRSHLNEITTAV